MIHVIASIEVDPGKRDAVLAEFRRLVPLVQAEVGCLEYSPTIDISSGLSAQASLRPNIVTVVEKWASVEALQAHSQAPHMKEYREHVKGLVTSVKIQVTEPAA